MSSSRTASSTSSTRCCCRRCKPAHRWSAIARHEVGATLSLIALRQVARASWPFRRPRNFVLPASIGSDFTSGRASGIGSRQTETSHEPPRSSSMAGATALAALAGTAALLRIGRSEPARAETFEVTKTDAEWRAILTDAAIRGAAPGGHRISRHQPAAAREAQGQFHLRRLRPAGLFVRDQVRFRHRLAEFLGSAAQRGRPQGRRLRCSWPAPKCIAGAAAAISATSSTTVRRRPASVTASTAWR